jgi:photolyase PhrII
MQGVAMRSRSNPALNFAVEQANRFQQPLLVYQGLRPDYPWASDRFHTFILESAADLANGFAERGIQYVFHLDTRSREERASPDGAIRSPLIRLARRASLVVTEFFPTFIQPRQLKRLRERIDPPVVAVDTATVVPVRYLTKAYLTARAIRPVLERALPHYLHEIPDVEPRVRRPVEVEFDPTFVRPELISTLVSRCDIDHRVGPSPTLPGGETAARRRLEQFVTRGLPHYETLRNDPNRDATSRLSAYLHFGNIGIQEVLLTARAADSGPNYAKFLDEALTWRELAHNFVCFDPRHRTMDAVPAWARRELEDHITDPRPAIYSPEELGSAATGSPLWNACQRSLLRDGELHNYVRMLWGKAVLMWTSSPGQALQILEHLNHKYALDGRDPNSYGGILWCFGKFDRPFYRRPIYGTVRYQSLTAQDKRFDVRAYIQRFEGS